MLLYLSVSQARRQFKRMLDHANHQIITALVGLHLIEKAEVKAAPEELNVTWSPCDPVASARRSRTLILDMALVRCVDALDAYIRLSNRSPALIQSEGIRSKLAKCGHSVFGKYETIDEYINNNDKLLSSLVAIAIVWRNRRVHSDADDVLRVSCKTSLRDGASEARGRFRGLEVDQMLDRFENNETPRFKEIASLIKATQDFVGIVEEYFFDNLDERRFLRELVWSGLSETNSSKKTREEGRKQCSERVWGKSGKNKNQTVERFLQRNGLSRSEPERNEMFVVFEESMVKELSSMNPREIRSWARPSAVAKLRR